MANQMSEQISDRRPLIPTPKTPLQKAGCSIVLVFWFALLLLPCAMFWLAFGNHITIFHANVPEPEDNPLLEIQLIMEIENRGLQITRTNIHENSTTELCVQSNVSYLLWQSDSNDPNVTFCECYERENSEMDWEFVGTEPGLCEE